MRTIEFINPNPHDVHLTGPDRKTVIVGSRRKIMLQEWFLKYAPAFIRVVREADAPTIDVKPVRPLHTIQTIPPPSKTVDRVRIAKPADPNQRINHIGLKADHKIYQRERSEVIRRMTNILSHGKRRAVGRSTYHGAQATTHFRAIIPTYRISFSNDIGVGILSYNRLHCIQRLLASIQANTDVARTMVFVSDESTNSDVKAWLRTIDWIVLLNNTERLGVAGNTNRLLQCLARFRYKILLNDDVEVLVPGWETFYPAAIEATKIHHFCHRQAGLCGASSSQEKTATLGPYTISTVGEKPQGAIMAFTDLAFRTVGFFDESMGTYGMEHVDWSNRISLSRIQRAGFHDVVGSNKYFRAHIEQSAVEDKAQQLAKARERYETVRHDAKRVRIDKSTKSSVPSISCVIPCRGTDRTKAIDTVVASFKAQNFPVIEIIVVEQDHQEKIRLHQLVHKLYVPGRDDFCKSAAFNRGVVNATHGIILLQDADIVCHRDYVRKAYDAAQRHEACHIGKEVIYMDGDSTATIVQTHKISADMRSHRLVGYFEGGSLACTKRAYFACGGFLEDYVGYGMEDCDFFQRLKITIKGFLDARTESFIHLEHGRVAGWGARHERNKTLNSALQTRHGNGSNLIRYCINKLRLAGYESILKSLQIS